MTQLAPQPLSARTDRAERTRQRIIDAAGSCFAATGFSKTTVEEIAARAGVSKGIVYHHFDGKDGLLERVVEQLCADWIEVSGLHTWIARTSSLEEAISGMLRGSLAYARAHPLVKGLFTEDPLVTRALGSSESVQRVTDESRRRMVDAIGRGIQSGELRQDLDADRVTDVIRMIDLALIDHLIAQDWIDVSDERFVDTCLDILFHGIGGSR